LTLRNTEQDSFCSIKQKYLEEIINKLTNDLASTRESLSTIKEQMNNQLRKYKTEVERLKNTQLELTESNRQLLRSLGKIVKQLVESKMIFKLMSDIVVESLRISERFTEQEQLVRYKVAMNYAASISSKLDIMKLSELIKECKELIHNDTNQSSTLNHNVSYATNCDLPFSFKDSNSLDGVLQDKNGYKSAKVRLAQILKYVKLKKHAEVYRNDLLNTTDLEERVTELSLVVEAKNKAIDKLIQELVLQKEISHNELMSHKNNSNSLIENNLSRSVNITSYGGLRDSVQKIVYNSMSKYLHII
jgi:choline kinase